MPLLDELTSMTADELSEVQARVSVLMQNQLPASGSSDEVLVHDAICQCLTQFGIPTRIPLSVIKRGKHWGAFHTGVPCFVNFITQYCKPKTKAERIKIASVLVMMLGHWLRECGVPLSHRTLSQSLVKVYDVVQQQFPGYLESGLLPILVASWKRSSTDTLPVR